MVDALPQNVTVVDDRAGNHYWIFDVAHTTGTATDVLVENSLISASQLTSDGSNSGDVQRKSDDSATDAVREIVIASGVETGLIKIVARFSGVAGTGSGHEDL